MPLQASLTASGAVVGTVFYMAPEQVYGERDLDHRIDVWALGVMLYECLAGCCPTNGDNVGQVLKVITSTGVAPIAEVAPEVPADVASLVMRMLAGDKTRRPSDLREVSEIVERHAGTPALPFPPPVSLLSALPVEDSSRRAASPAASTATFDGIGLIPTQPVPAVARESRRPPRLAQRLVRRISVALALLSVMALGVAAIVTAPRRSPPPRTSGDDAPASAAAAPLSSSPPSSTPPPPPEVVPVATAVASVVATPRPRRPSSKADAGVTIAPAPSASPSARATPGGIVETPPF
jgi:serine/threonine-protein kinase